MKLKSTLLLFIVATICSTVHAQIRQEWCIQNATISASGGQSSLYFCEGDGIPDKVRFKVAPFVQPFAYLVTDENNIILRVSRNNTIDFEGIGGGKLRVWAFAYLGNILAEPGQDATTAVLADICYGLTQNFIPVGSIIPNARSIATSDGRTSLFTCPGDGNPDVVNFTTTSTDPFYTYVITDLNNIILGFSSGDSFDFENLSQSQVRVWGVSYVGTIQAKIGDNLGTVAFASGCFDVSDNYIDVTRVAPKGGTVSLSSGETRKTVCADNLQGSVLTFISKNNSQNPYAFIVTDQNGNVISILNGNTVNFALSTPGICRVYGISFTGELKIAVGDNINSTVLSDDCFDLSSNFVEVIKREVDGGTVSLTGDGNNATVCVEGGTSQEVSFASTAADTSANFVYIITNENNVIQAVVTGNTFNFASLNNRINRIWGLSYTGMLLAKPGDNAATAALSSECYDLSDNFITIIRKAVDGNVVHLESGVEAATVCGGDGVPDQLAFINNSTSVENYIYVITDENGKVLSFINGNLYDFEGLNFPTVRVYGLSYSGTLRLKVGDNINNVAPSSECSDLSNNFVTITRKTINGGTVSLAGGGTSAMICSGDATSDVLNFATTSTAGGNYTYVITGLDNEIIAFANGDSYDFAGMSNGIFRVWGLSYSGNVLAAVGDNATQTALSDECYQLSSNFIVVTRNVVDGATISLEDGSSAAIFCLGSGPIGQLIFTNTSTAGSNYAYLLTTADNIVIETTLANDFDLTGFPEGAYKVWGVSYRGNLTVLTGDDAATTALSDECYDLSDNFVSINTQQVDGGTVSLSGGGDTTTICIGDANPDTLEFATTVTTGNYVFVVTDENNTILSFSSDGKVDFTSANAGICRVWGLSYSGNLIASVGENAAEALLSDECFDLSDNFVTVNKVAVDGGTVSTTDGAEAATICLGDGGSDVLTFTAQTASTGSYIFVVTDENNVILSTSTDGVVDFGNAPAGVCHLWGLSYTGNLIAQAGDDATTAALSDECYDLSSNFVTVTRKLVDGGTVSLSDGSDTTTVCLGDLGADVLTFTKASQSTENYIYVITDENNVILNTSVDGVVDFGNAPAGICHLWGLSYTGNLTAQIGDDATTTALSDECYDLSDNFVTVIRKAVDGATVSLANGDTTSVACTGVPEVSPLHFINTSNAGANYAYLVTSDSNQVLAVVMTDSFSFASFPQGTYRVWGVSYTGNLIVQTGDDAATTALSDECYDLSDNFITVTQKAVEGGTVSMLNGDTSVIVCGSTSTPGLLQFTKQTTSNADYLYFITDLHNNIFIILNGNSLDFNAAGIGTYRVWGASYTGNITARTGRDLFTIQISDECFDISDNFILITKDLTTGGTVAEASGNTAFTFCPGNGNPDVLQFTTTGNSNGAYTYVITDDQNAFIQTITGDSFDFDALPEGAYRVWGLAYTGNITIQPGDNAATVNLTDQCYDLSENFISVTNVIPNGGTVSLAEEETRMFTCPKDGNPDIVEFFHQGNKGPNFVYLITDENNIIQEITTQNSYDFESDTEGTNHVWGLAYNGTLTAQVGDDATTAALSDDCFDLSDNFIEIIRETPVGGDVTLQNGDTLVYVCLSGTQPAVLKFDSTGTSRGDYIYVITDENNVIRNGIFGDEFDFSFLPPSTYRVWGLAYTGMLTATIGDVVTDVPISDDCYNLSDTYATVVVGETDGGTVATSTGATSLMLCTGDGNPDVVAFDSVSTSTAAYTYLITDKNNLLLGIIQGDHFDFDNSTIDTCLVWGLSYTGNLTALPGDDVTTAMLAEGCQDLSSNVVTITKSRVDGATITSDRKMAVIYTCVNDGVPDVVTFTNFSNAANAQYVYVLTNESNVIRQTITGNQFDFETAGVGTSRVWGVSYTGTFTGAFGQNITTAQLASGCFEVSENYITVSRDMPFGGAVSTIAGETSTAFCPSLRAPSLSFSTTSNQRAGYVYIVTDTNNTIVAFSTDNEINFQKLPVGNYRVWGLSYTGGLQFRVGDNILGTDPLATSCFELSANFVEVYRATMVDGGTIHNIEGPDTLYVCPNNETPDLVVPDNNSQATDAAYRYVLTDRNNIVLSRNLDNDVIDFNGAMPGTYRIWGVSFTGNFVGIASDTVTSAILSDSCYETSANYIEVIVGVPNGGAIATTDSLTSISAILGDGQPDAYSFRASGASSVKYQYIIADDNDQIISFIDGNSFDFEGFPNPELLHIWGLAYTGNLTAAIGDTITQAVLSDDCYDLSSNFIQVAFATPVVDNHAENNRRQAITSSVEENTPMRVTVAPNPAVERIQVNVIAPKPESNRANLRIYSLTGQMMYEENVPIEPGINQITVRINDLPDGLYLLQVRDAKQLQTVRFLKQWQ